MAKIIAETLGGEMDMILVKKIGHPSYPEFALGAVTEDAQIVLGAGAIQYGLSEDDLEKQALELVQQLREKRQRYGQGRAPIDPRGRVVIIVDDGIATGATMSAAYRSLKEKGAARVIVAAPVASVQAVRSLRKEGAEVRTVFVPEYFGAVGYYYDDFTQVSDAEIGAFFRIQPVEITIQQEDIQLNAMLGLPARPSGIILFAHGSGSGRFSPRNQFVAEELNRHGFATVLADLLTVDEAPDQEKVFDIHLLAGRLIGLTKWVAQHEKFKGLRIGYFGASTGAAAAIMAAAQFPGRVHAVVTRGGRPDLAMAYLDEVSSPTLLIVGSLDTHVLELNRRACKRLTCQKRLEVIDGATHLFEEPGTLELVAECAQSWFRQHLMNQHRPAPEALIAQ